MKLVDSDVLQQAFLKSVVEQALDLASVNSDAAEVTLTKTSGIDISTRYGEVENIKFKIDNILGITVYCQQRKGSASSTDLRPEAIARTVTAALGMARYTSPDSCLGLSEKKLLAFNAPELDLFHPIELTTEFGVALAAEAECTAMKKDKCIKYTDGGNFHSSFSTRVFGNSSGMLQSYSSSCYSLSCSVIAENNSSMERNYAYTLCRSFDDLLSPQWVGEECANRTLSHLHPRKLPTMEASVLFVAEVATSLFSHLACAISGSNVYRKATFLLNCLDRVILPEWLSINEYPHLPKGLASSPFDDEGLKTSDRIIIKDGVLNTWLLSSYTARKLGLESTGHAGGGIYNWQISHQNINFTGLVKKMNRGLIVTELMGQGVNIMTGDYSRGVAGFWVDNGEIQYPVSEITIAGNLREMLHNIVYIGNDIEIRNNIHCGSVLLTSMKIAGQ